MKPTHIIALLLLIFFAATFSQPDNVSVDEARYLWIVRDEIRDYPPGIRDFARTARDNVQTMLSRTPLSPYPVLLDAWTWVAGDSAEMARVFSLFCVLIGTAAVLGFRQRLTRVVSLPVLLLTPVLILAARQISPTAVVFMTIALAIRIFWRLTARQRGQMQRIGVPLVTGAIVLYLLVSLSGLLAPKLDWNAINSVLARRNPLHPIITTFPAESPLGYYDFRYGLRQGIAPNLAWREFSESEITALIEGLTRGGYPVWGMMPKDDAKTQKVMALLEARGYRQAETSEIDGVVFYRYESES